MFTLPFSNLLSFTKFFNAVLFKGSLSLFIFAKKSGGNIGGPGGSVCCGTGGGAGGNWNGRGNWDCW